MQIKDLKKNQKTKKSVML